MMKILKFCFCFYFVFLFSCSSDEFYKQPNLSNKVSSEDNLKEVPVSHQKNKISRNIKCVTYNFHSGHSFKIWTNTKKFLKLLSNEDLVFMQEVKPNQVWVIKTIFKDYPYVFYSKKNTTKLGINKKEGILTLSKYPLEIKEDKIIQIDPQGDLWERKAQHVAVKKLGKTIHFFHYHNTYNFDENDFFSERKGMQNFVDYTLKTLNEKSVKKLNNTVFLGDFNVFSDHLNESLPTVFHKSNGRDHINTNMPVIDSGIHYTVNAKISDHNAVWITFKI